MRDPSTVSDKRDRLRYVKGNIFDAAAVKQQIAGQDVVIEAVSSRAATKDSNAAPSGPPGSLGVGL